MNHIYRSIWNAKTGNFVAVSENTKNGGKSASGGAVVESGFALKTLAVSMLMAFGSHAYALPVDGVVTAGKATITSGMGHMTINQGSQNAALDWQSFNIGRGEAVTFVQPNSSAVALNRVLGADPSTILGNLSANGKVFLINPNGILFGRGASVNVGSLVASTLNLSNSDFMAGRYQFSGAGTGTVLNQGAIRADGGFVALLGANVSNQGTINARLGTVALAAGNAVTLDVAGDGFINVTVDQGALKALVENGGMIQADGGQVLLSAQAAGDLLHTVVNNTGIVQAQTIDDHHGTIRLLGDMQGGTVNVGGKLDASAPDGGNGGFIDTSAAHVKIAGDTQVTAAAAHGLTGTWLIDPVDFTIAAGNAAPTTSGIGAATLGSNLASSNVSIVTSDTTGGNGDIFVNSAVAWSANKLTLSAHRNINVNLNLNASGTASLALEYGQGALAAGNTGVVNVNAPINLPAGNNFSTKQGSDGSVKQYTVITSLGAAGSVTTTDLQGMNGNIAGNYVLGANIDAAPTSTWNGGAGFAPVVGSELVTFGGGGGETFTYTNLLPFVGVFDGLGHTISGLVINRPAEANIGMFGLTGSTSVVRNVGLTGGSVAGFRTTGALVAENHGSVNNSYAATPIVSNSANGLYVGGLVGSNFGSISDSYATGAVSGERSVGGLVGTNGMQGGSSIGSISRSYATGAVSAGGYLSGGLAGGNERFSSISDSYATGSVTGGKNVSGGLSGSNYGTISTSYATGAVTNPAGFVGGLVGANGYSGTIALSHSSGAVSGGSNVGGLTGRNFGQPSAVSNSYWNTETSGRATSGGGTGLTTVQMQTASNFAGFNFTTTPGATGNNWVMVDVDGSLNNAGGAPGATRPMLASEYSTLIANGHQLQLMNMNLAGNYTLSKNIDLGAELTGASGMWGNSAGFVPIGTVGTQFTGTFDGLGHTITGVTINQPSLAYVGLFGATGPGSAIGNVGLINGSVTGDAYIGALVGRNGGTVYNSYASTSVSGTAYVGGLVGYVVAGGKIDNSYASGTVAALRAGGLVGRNEGAISNSYVTGAVSGSNAGGLLGLDTGTVTNSFWDTQASGLSTSAGGTGMTTAQMQTRANFTSTTTANGNINPAWDIGGAWVMYDGHTSPLLRSFMTALTVTTSDAGKTYDGLAYSGNNGVTYSSTPNGNLLGAVSYGGSAQGAVNAGSYVIAASGLYSTQNGYVINYVDGALTVAKVNLALSSANVSKTYDGGVTALGTVAINSGALVSGDTISGGTFAFTDANVGSGNKTVTTGAVTVSDGNGGGNYNVSYVNNSTSTITPAILSATASASDKTYDGNNIAAATLNIVSGLIGSETLNVTGAATSNTKDVLTANLVTVNSISLANGSNGGLASNYLLAAGQTTAAKIIPKALTVSGMTAANKTYDGNTAAKLDGGTLQGLIGAETLALRGQTGTFADKNVGTAKAVTITGTTLADGTGMASNYSIANPTGLVADVTRLTAVTWVGGASGNWFDPVNWAGGAVPDLTNVANVVIPAGVTVSFNDGIVASPSQAGAVNVDSIGSAGSLNMVDGSLRVGAGVKLTSIKQSGGTFAGGTIEVGSLSQSGGAFRSTGNLTVTDAYSQSGSGASIVVGGNASITQTSGSTMLGNIATAGPLNVAAANGNITQLSGTSIASAGAGTLAAPNGTVSLAGSGNSLGAVTIVDSNSSANSSGGGNDAPLQNALAGALSIAATNGPGGNTGTFSSAEGQSLRGIPSGSFSKSILAGLNVALVDQGVKLPPGVAPDEANDDEKK